MKRRWLVLCLTILVLLGSVLPAYADVEASQMRHSVVVVEVGAQGNAGYIPFSSGTGFFIGEEGVDPSYLMTNFHVVNDVIALGNGEENNFSTFFIWFLEAVQGFTQAEIQAILSDEAERNKWINAVGNQVWAKFAGSNIDNKFRMIARVYFDDEDWVEAYVVDHGDETKDMALLRLEKPTDKRVPLKVCVPVEDMVGHNVTAIGYPGASSKVLDPVSDRGENDSTVTTGTVSRLATETGTGRRTVQYTASINHGNSGGPLILTETGAAIALNTWGSNLDSNMYFGVSMEEVIPMLKNNNVSFDLVEYPPVTEEPDIGVTEEADSSATNEPVVNAQDQKPGVNGTMAAGIAVVVIAIAAAAFFVSKNKKPDPAVPSPGPSPRPNVNPNDSMFRIQCVRGVQGNKRVMIPMNGQVVMGRKPDCGIKFPENTKGVSGKHCAVYYENGVIKIVDLGSTFGTFIEPGQKLTANQPVQLPAGRKFWLGSENECFVIEQKVQA